MLLRDAPPFLNASELAQELTRFKYRPGWDLSVFEDRWEGPCLYVRTDVANGYDPSETVELRIRSAIPPIPDAEYFAIWLQWRLIQIENHESREFLHHNGRPKFDPHDPIEPGGNEGPVPLRKVEGS